MDINVSVPSLLFRDNSCTKNEKILVEISSASASICEYSLLPLCGSYRSHFHPHALLYNELRTAVDAMVRE